MFIIVLFAHSYCLCKYVHSLGQDCDQAANGSGEKGAESEKQSFSCSHAGRDWPRKFDGADGSRSRLRTGGNRSVYHVWHVLIVGLRDVQEDQLGTNTCLFTHAES